MRRRRLSRPFDRRDGRGRDPLIQLFPALPGRVAGLRMIAGYGFKVSAAPNQYLLVHDLCCCLAVIPAQRDPIVATASRSYPQPRNPKRLTSHHASQSIVSPTRGSLWVDLVCRCRRILVARGIGGSRQTGRAPARWLAEREWFDGGVRETRSLTAGCRCPYRLHGPAPWDAVDATTQRTS